MAFMLAVLLAVMGAVAVAAALVHGETRGVWAAAAVPLAGATVAALRSRALRRRSGELGL
jgi:hypothetical protein